MGNHYFIGIGGTGGNVLRELKKAEFFRQEEIDACGNDLQMRFLYVDSNELELNEASKQWQVLGNSVELSPAERMLIRSGDIAEAVRNVGLRPNISSWLGDPQLISDMVGAAEGVPGAQQRRRFGRFLFAAHVVDFCRKVRTAVGEMAQDGLGTCMFHLIGTLAGGTGSGGLIDAALQIRREFPNATNNKIIIYVLVTDDDAKDADAGYFYENQYAALKDINAALVGKGSFNDISTGQVLGGESSLQQPIHKCVLVSNRNRHHINLSKSKQEKILADWLLQIAIAGTQHNLSQDFQHALTAEDTAVVHPAEPSVKNQLRSYRFGAVGILRWAAPQNLIRERFGYLVARQIGNQLLFNNLCNKSGEFLEESKVSNIEEFSKAHSLAVLGLTWKKLIQVDEDQAESYEVEFGLLGANLKKSYDSTPDDSLERCEEEIRLHFDKGFHDVGVRKHYSSIASMVTERKGLEQRSKSEALIQSIESTLCTAFLDGQLGLRDVSQVATGLLDGLQTEREQCRTLRDLAGDRITQIETSISSGGRKEWRKVGWLSRLFGKKKSLMRTHVDRQVELHICKSQIEECMCAEQAIDALREGLGGLKTAVQRIIETFGRAQQRLREEAATIERQLFEPQDLTRVEIDRDGLRSMEREMARSNTHIAPAAFAVRQELFSDGSFFDLARSVETTFFDHMVRDSDTTVQQAHDDLVRNAAAGLDPVIGVNLLEVLFRKHGGTVTADLKKEIVDFMSMAVEALEIDNTAPTPSQVTGAKAPEMPRGMLLIQVPVRPAMSDPNETARMVAFEDDIKNNLKNALQNAPKIEFAPATDSTEITVVDVISWMAARYSSAVNGLKRKYLETMNNTRDTMNADYFCHLDDNHDAAPDLFPADTKDVRIEAETLLDLGLLCEVVIEGEESALLLLQHAKDDGVVIPKQLAKSRKEYLNQNHADLENCGSNILAELAVVPEEEAQSALQKETEELKELAKDPKILISEDYRNRGNRLERFREIMSNL